MSVHETRSWLIDMDGVIVREEEPIEGSAEFLARLHARDMPFLVLTLLGGGGITRGRPEWRAAPTAGDQSYRPAPSTTRLCRRRWHSAMTIGGLDRSVRAVPAERCR
jgi:hypothetical protein